MSSERVHVERLHVERMRVGYPPRIGRVRRIRRKDSGYTLLLLIFLVATMLILGAVATQSVLTAGRREREEDMVWRGEQYERAIGLFYRKLGHYPTKIDDLTKATNGVRFLRQAYTDPTNKTDGSWRLIYIGPNGQLTGSNLYQNILQYQMAVQGASAATTPANVNGSPAGSPVGAQSQQAPSSGIFGILAGASGGSGASGAAGGTSTPANGAAGPGAPGTPGTAQNQNPSDAGPQPQPLGGQVLGGNIVGIGSNTKDASIMVFQGAKTYDDWEFLWAPAATAVLPGQVGQPIQGTPGQAGPGQNGTAAPGAAPNGTPPAAGPGSMVAPGIAPAGTPDQTAPQQQPPTN